MMTNGSLTESDRAIVREIVREVIRETREDTDLRTREAAHAIVSERIGKAIQQHQISCPFGKSISVYRAYVVGWAAGGGAVGGTITGIILMIANWIF